MHDLNKILILTTCYGMEDFPQLTATPVSRFHLSWQSNKQGTYDIRVLLVDGADELLDNIRRINANIEADQLNLDIAVHNSCAMFSWLE